MQQIRTTIQNMITISPSELEGFLKHCYHSTFARKEIIHEAGAYSNEIYFLNKGLIRSTIEDKNGTVHTVHFALENQFIAEYSSFLTHAPAAFSLQALEETEVTVIPRASIDWGYKHLAYGDRLGRLVAEFYFIYKDDRIRQMYAHTPKERYDAITQTFPNIHNRVPQHMIASYHGITPVHLSRLKRAALAES